METIGNLWLYLAFFGIVAVMLLIDFLGFKQKEGQDVKIKTAAYWSIAWVTVASLFGCGLWLYLQQTAGVTVANTKVHLVISTVPVDFCSEQLAAAIQ